MNRLLQAALRRERERLKRGGRPRTWTPEDVAAFDAKLRELGLDKTRGELIEERRARRDAA